MAEFRCIVAEMFSGRFLFGRLVRAVPFGSFVIGKDVKCVNESPESPMRKKNYEEFISSDRPLIFRYSVLPRPRYLPPPPSLLCIKGPRLSGGKTKADRVIALPVTSLRSEIRQ